MDKRNAGAKKSDIGAKSDVPVKTAGGMRAVLLGMAAGTAAFLIAAAGFFAYPQLMKSEELPHTEQNTVSGETEEIPARELPEFSGGEAQVTEQKTDTVPVESPLPELTELQNPPEVSEVPQISDSHVREEDEQQRQMALIFDQAALLADSGDYSGAVRILSAAPQEWQETETFRNAAVQYRSEWEADVLSNARVLADNGQFTEAVRLLSAAQESLPESTALNAAVSDYSMKNLAALKEDALTAAQEQANSGAYIDAIVTLRQVLQSIGEDAEISQVILAYENAYTASIAVIPQTPVVQDIVNPNQNARKPSEGSDVDITGGSSLDKAVRILAQDINHASFSTEKQVGWYQVTTSPNHSIYRFDLLNNSINTTTYITVYDAYQQELGKASANQGEHGYVDLVLEPETTYWIKFSRYNDSRMGNYQFSVLEKICDAGTERRNAYTIATDTQYVKELDAAGINDWFVFTVGENYSSYRIELQNNSINTTVYFTLYDEYETKVAETSVSEGNSGFIDITPAPNKQYHLRVSRYNGERLGYYQFNICEKVCDAGIHRSEAFGLALPAVQQGAFDTTFNDWYTVTIPEEGYWKFDFTNNSINTTVYMTVYDIYEMELYDQGCSQNSGLSYSQKFDKDTVLYVRISRYNDERLGKYTLTISR